MMPRLSQRQSKILRYIVDFYKRHKYPPIFYELQTELEMTGSTVRYNVYRLQEFGYVDCLRKGRMVRGILPLWKE
jgi:repressor LexA